MCRLRRLAQAHACLRKGGTALVVGVPPPSNPHSPRTASLVLEEKTIEGSYRGSTRLRFDFARLVSLYQAGKLERDELITRRCSIDEASQAFDDLVQGRNARGVIVFG
jgi:S-(hydroxymethyl)glutathione dehydrogenase/alcohol dehydrogenase